MSFNQKIQKEFQHLITFKKTNRKWPIPFLVAISMGTPLLVGLYFGNLQYGLTACLSGLVMLYLPDSGSFTNRILTVMVCSFGFMVSFAFGLLFSFNPIVSAIALGVFSMVVHWIILYYKTAPPRSFFFILIAAMAICQPFNLNAIPTKVGLLGLGTMFTAILAILYTFLLFTKDPEIASSPVVPVFKKNPAADFWEALIMGGFMLLSLLIGRLLHYSNPYWIPISCAAVMQGASLYHIWQRTFHRILGTFIGIGLTWLIITIVKTPLEICLTIILLQTIVETLIVRQYAIAVLFITPMTILLAEAANPIYNSPTTLITLRFIEIAIGSILGAIGGWLLYKEKIRFATIEKFNQLKNSFKR